MLLETGRVGGRVAGERLGAAAGRQYDATSQPLDAQFVVIAVAPAEEKINRAIEQHGHQIWPLGELGIRTKERRDAGPPAAADRRAIAGDEQPVAAFDPLLESDRGVGAHFSDLPRV